MFSNNFLSQLSVAPEPVWLLVLAAVCAYFAGNINGAILIGKAYGVDVRKEGSGNAGTTNALRSLGKKAGAVTFATDVAKGWAVFFLASHFGSIALAYLCGLCVVLGHIWPVTLGFKGGKGVATTFAVLLAAAWPFALILLGVVALFIAIFRRVSLAVLIAVATGLVLCFSRAGGLAAGIDALWLVVLFALIVWMHRANIGRLLRGEEPKLTLGSRA